MSRFSDLVQIINRRSLWQVLLVYLGASYAILEALDLFTDRFGLPDFLFTVAIILLLIGLPIILLTAVMQRGERAAASVNRPGLDLGDVKRFFTWRNAVIGGVSAFAVWGIVAAGWLLLRGVPPRNAPVEESLPPLTRIAVLPFSVRGSDSFAYLGAGMVDLLSTKLDGAGGWRRVDPRAVLAFLTQSGSETPDPQSGRGIAQRFDARFYVLGNVVEVGGRLRIDASLYDAAGGTDAVTDATAEGAAADIFGLVDELAAQLLLGQTAVPGTGVTRIAAVTTNNLEALKAYLEGEREFRSGHFAPAVEAFQRATQQDSAFALGWYRLSVAADWLVRADLVTRSAEQAYRYSGRLSEHDRRLFEALQTARRAEVVEAERLFRSILRSYPDDVEAWFQLGELQFHFGPFRGRSISESREAFERVNAFEPDNVHALIHLARIASTERNRAELDSLVRRYLVVHPDADRTLEIRTLRALSFGDAAERGVVLRELRGADDVTLMIMGWGVPVFGDNLAGGIELNALLSDSSRAPEIQALGHIHRAALEVARGRWSEAEQQLAAAERLNPPAALLQRAFLSALPLAPVSEGTLRDLRAKLEGWNARAARPSPTPSTWLDVHDQAYPQLRLYLLGLLSARLGDPGVASRYAAELEASNGLDYVSALAHDLAYGVRAQAAFVRGEASEALVALEALEMKIWYQRMAASPFFSQANERYLRAEALRAVGREAEAIRWYSSFSQGSIHDLVYLAPSHLRRAEIYERQGDRDEALRHYRRFSELWRDSDPELQPLLRAAEAQIAELAGESPKE